MRRDLKLAGTKAELLARLCAAAVLELPLECSLLPDAVVNYWSPRSMRPADSLPPWNWASLRCFTLPGIPGSRFVWAETVGKGAPSAGNVHQVAPGALA